MSASSVSAREVKRGILAAVCAAAGVALLAPAVAHGMRAPGAVGAMVQGKKGAAQFWTKKRMRHAKPLDLRRPGGDPEIMQRAPVRGRPVKIPATRPARRSSSRVPRSHIPFDQSEILDTTTYPARVHGKVFFVKKGREFVCSATVVSTDNASVVFTAGHCVKKPGKHGKFFTKLWIFVPGYDHGFEPFGEFVGNELWTTKKWSKKGRDTFDVGAVILGPNEFGRVADVVGSRGIAFNQPRAQNYQEWGYPAAEGFDGESLWVCNTVYGGDDRSEPGPPALETGCDLPSGSSGGGWVIQDEFLNSVTSYGYDVPTHNYGPYFGSAISKLYNDVNN